MSADRLDVLLIEDNPGDVRLIEEMLDGGRPGGSDSGGAVVSVPAMRHADRLADGLAILEEATVDVVLLDLGLPDSNGLETLESVREQSWKVPIVVLTGLNDESVGDRAVQHGAQEYLVKDELTPALLRRSLRHAIERKKFERTQTALHDASRDLIQAGTKTDVSQVVLETAVDVLDLSGVGIYLFEDETNVLEPAAYTDYVESIFGELPSFGPDDTAITWQAFIGGETITLGDVNDSEHVHREDTPLESGMWIPLGDHGVIAIVSEERGGFDQQTQQLADHLAATAEAAFDRVEREEALREQGEELTRQNRQLAELDRMNRLIREIDQVLVQASTRDAIEEAVCDILVGDDRFAFAWIGEATDDRVEPRTRAGSTRGYLDAVSLGTDGDADTPSVSAATTGEVALVSNVASDLRGAPWRKAALARDMQSAIAIPLTYNDLSYGVLTVYATEPDAFDTVSAEIFEELGGTIANAMNAVETRQMLLTDTVVELELAIRDEDALLANLAREADCELEYGGTVPQSDGASRLFFDATGASPSAVEAAARAVPRIRDLELVSEGDGEDDESTHRFEMIVTGQTIPATVVECGGVARSIRTAGSEVGVVLELPGTTDVRTFVDRLEATYPDTDLVARRDRERTDDSLQPFETALAEQLTDRQLEILQTAYLSGYFEWPRDRTGEEVAESLGITQPTFNGHLRAAERKLCAMLFEGPGAGAE